MFGVKAAQYFSPLYNNYPLSPGHEVEEEEETADMGDLFGGFEDEPKAQEEPLEPNQLWRGSQEHNVGPINSRVAFDYFKTLENVKACGVRIRRQPGCNYVEGGTCSAMSFRLVKEYLSVKEASPKAKETMVKMEGLFKTSSEEFRTVQFVYNEMARDSSADCKDFKRAKIETMAAFHGLKVTDASEAIDIKESTLETIHKISDFLAGHERGVFLIRALNLDPGTVIESKEEHYGHSLVLVKEKNKQFFYDPNGGCRKVKGAEALHEMLVKSHIKWNTPEHRFYKIEA